MRCDKMHATITVDHCLKNQFTGADESWGFQGGSLKYPGCKDCLNGTLAREGKLDDSDIEELKQRIMEERGMGIKRVAEPVVDGKKMCTKCGEMKDLSEFARRLKGTEIRVAKCGKCHSKYQKERRVKLAVEEGKQEEPTPTKETTAPACIQEAIEDSRARPAPTVGGQECPPSVEPKERVLEIYNPRLPSVHVLILDFSCYPEVLEEIKSMAEELERPPEVQARYMVRKVIEAHRQQRFSFSKEGNAI
jgi:hypothetical protein